MNRNTLLKYIDYFKTPDVFNHVVKYEGYKWEAFSHFEKHWDIEASDFKNMINNAFSKSLNLLNSQNYFPLRMLNENSLKDAEKVRELFRYLSNAGIGLLDRISFFKTEFKKLNQYHFIDKNSYQDHRAISVYLSMIFPETHYLYKYGMFKDVAEKLAFSAHPKRGNDKNILLYNDFCDYIKEELISDTELMAMHKARIPNHLIISDEANYNLLTQDFIYAVNRHIHKFIDTDVSPSARITNISKDNVILKKHVVVLKARANIDYESINRKNTQIGRSGEYYIVEKEKCKLKELGITKEVEHTSIKDGDGLGYDILSYNEKGEKIYIEVKTTVDNFDSPIYITENELQASEKYKNCYYLYRVFYFGKEKNTADILVWNGSLAPLCNFPILYKTVIEEVFFEKK